MEKYIYQIEIAIDEQTRDETLSSFDEEDSEILSAIESLPYVITTNLKYAVSEQWHKNLKSESCNVYEKDF